MAEKNDNAAKLSASRVRASLAREGIQHCLYRLGACSPVTIETILLALAYEMHTECLRLPVTPGDSCDQCNAREALCGILRDVRSLSSEIEISLTSKTPPRARPPELAELAEGEAIDFEADIADAESKRRQPPQK